MQEDLFYTTVDTQLLDDEVIEARVGGIRACCGDHVGDFIEASSPFIYGFLAGIDRKPHAFLPEDVIQLFDSWGIWLVDKRMVDIANGSSSLDAGETIDG